MLIWAGQHYMKVYVQDQLNLYFTPRDNIILLNIWHFQTLRIKCFFLRVEVQIGIGDTANSHNRRSNFSQVNIHLPILYNVEGTSVVTYIHLSYSRNTKLIIPKPSWV